MNDDFLKWDDLDLDDLLGVFTGSESGDDESAKTSNFKRQKTTAVTSKVTYSCSEEGCNRCYKSAAGLRGHLVKQHKKTDNNVSYHRSTSTNDQSPEFKKRMEDVFSVLVQSMLRKMTEDPLNRNSVNGSEVAWIAGEALPYSDVGLAWLSKPFIEVMSAGGSLNRPQQRETLCRRFIAFRLCSDLKVKFQDFFSNTVGLQSLAQLDLFVQGFYDDLLDEFLSWLKAQTTLPSADVDSSTLSPHDQEILQYIAGYVVHQSLRDRHLTSTQKEVLLTLVKELADRTTVKENVPTWISHLDRGGLKHPTKSTCDLFMAVEAVLRGTCDIDRANAHTLQKDILLNGLLKHDKVRRAWTIAVPGFLKHMDILKKLLSLFLNVRGHAAAKHVKRKVLGRGKRETKKGTRKTLKM